jgi:DNA-directed RNA polymerase beta subunit
MVEPLAAIAGADTPSVNFAQPMAVGVQQFMIMKQLVSAVAHVRNEGPVAVDTRQAPGGAKRKGGLRFGCMEYDCVKDVGTTVLLKQQLNSDKHRQKLPICLACGLTQTKPVVVDIRCAGCGSSGTGAFGVAFVPFTFVSIIAALATVGVSVHLKCTHSLPREELPRVGVDGTPASIDIQYVDISSIECVNREEAP